MSPAGAARSALAAVVALVWVGAPVAVVAALTRQVDAVRFAQDEPAWVSARAMSEQVERRFGLALAWQPGPTAVAPGWDGVVEVRHVEPGDVLRTGDSVAVVGGATRVAHAGDRPVTRVLRHGDRGPDVAVLHGLLTEHGLASGGGDQFTAATAVGVRAFAAQVGAGRTDQFDPAWVLHLSAPELVVVDVDLTVGAPVPVAGSIVVTGAPVLDDAVVTTQDWAAFAATRAREAAEVATTPGPVGAAPAVGDDARTVPADAELRVGGVALPLSADRDRVDPAGLATLQAAVDRGVVAVDAVAVSPPLPGSWAVPATAVRSVPDGTTVVHRDRGGDRADVVVVVVGADGPSSTVVTGDLAPSDLVEVPAAGVP